MSVDLTFANVSPFREPSRKRKEFHFSKGVYLSGVSLSEPEIAFLSEVIPLGGMLHHRIKEYLMHPKCNPKERSPMLSFEKLFGC
ncbi:hypothetical protein H5410_000952 [Solanum commersonii]|uniref:Uncharacterized protein n=1 Tax=Solanum commersonii TaxID=4109 RepID=A0A9J6AYD0_SOLCO|nr:hypothetical protein H5410_000952 [Solanum commersonii]